MKISSTTKSNLYKFLRGCGVALFWLIVWDVAAAAVDLSLLLPSPATTLNTLLALTVSSSYWTAIWTSLVRILLGYLTG